MAVKVAINGFGRIGKAILRSNFERDASSPPLEIKAINDLGSSEVNTHLTKFDSVHGQFNADISLSGNKMVVNGNEICMFSERDPKLLPWSDLDIDVVLECTGLFTKRERALDHIHAGAKKILISAPGVNADATIVYGVNHNQLSKEHIVVSNASCTTNCLAPVAQCLNNTVGIESGLMTTIHSYTNDQILIDSYHSDVRRARSATLSMIPTKTGAALAIGLVLPELEGCLDGFSMRVPTANVSVIDLTFVSNKKTNVEEVNKIVKDASKSDQLKGILGYNSLPLVSIDFNHDPRSSVFDSTQTRVSPDGKLVKILSWYDNEWGFSNRMIDTALKLAETL
jgi:glyceraldehyde 3-phosphate dehydrogenase